MPTQRQRDDSTVLSKHRQVQLIYCHVDDGWLADDAPFRRFKKKKLNKILKASFFFFACENEIINFIKLKIKRKLKIEFCFI